MKARFVFLVLIAAIVFLVCSIGRPKLRPSESTVIMTCSGAGHRQEVTDLPVGVAVRVDGFDINEQEVAEEMEPMLVQLNRDYADREPNGEYDHSRRVIRGRAIENLIAMHLIDKAMDKYNIVISEDLIESHIKASAIQNGMTLEELKALVTSRDRQTYRQWKRRMQYDKRLGIVELIKIHNSDDLEVREAEAHEFYLNYHHLFERPERVRARHILVKIDPDNKTDQTVDDAKAKINRIMTELKNGADFAELARLYSDCPSAKDGGDLGYAVREAWVPEFSEAAFALQTDQISNVIKTDYGYHIIKITDRQDAQVTEYAEVKDKIIDRLRKSKQSCLRQQYLMTLINNAKIEYAPSNLITMTPLISL